MTLKNCLLISFILCLAPGFCFSQTGSISGVVTDSLTGKPVDNLSVFIPYTTIGTTTDTQGRYTLANLAPGDYNMMFRHISYQIYSLPVTIKAGKKIVYNLVAAESTSNIDEVVITGGKADPHWGYVLFKKFFLGDPDQIACVLLNPEALRYYENGNGIIVYANEPLKIMNRHLGYRITYYLDYFKYVENSAIEHGSQAATMSTALKILNKNKIPVNTDAVPYYAYSGSALYEDLSPVMPLNALNWKYSREDEFKGSLKHFLACLYDNKLGDNGYTVRKAYGGYDELRQSEKVTQAIAKVWFAKTDSVFLWDSKTGKVGYMHYFPIKEYVIGPDQIHESAEAGVKTLTAGQRILIFRDCDHTTSLRDDWTFTIQITDGFLAFDHEGNYGVPEGELIRTNLNYSARIRVLLPLDYLPKTADAKQN
jgi:hypothetical protein